MIFAFVIRFLAVWLIGSWLVMWVIGGIHSWWYLVPSIGYMQTLEILFLPAVIFVANEFGKILFKD